MVGSTYTLQHSVHRFWRVDLNNSPHAPHVDSKFQTGRANQSCQRPFPQLVLHGLPSFGCQRTVMNTNAEIWSQRRKTRRQGFGVASAVHEHQTRSLIPEYVAQLTVTGVLSGTKHKVRGTDFVFSSGDGGFHGEFGLSHSHGDEWAAAFGRQPRRHLLGIAYGGRQTQPLDGSACQAVQSRETDAQLPTAFRGG